MRLWLPYLAAALLPIPAWGQQVPTGPRPDVAEMSLEELMEVEVVFAASRHEENPREAPFPVFIVSRDEIRQHGCRTLAEVLERVPGFYITNDRNYQYVGVRGFGRTGDYNAHVLVQVNGTRVNDNVFDYVGIGGDFVVDMDLVDRVEVVVGPSGSLYGNSAFFAVVNVVTRRGRDLAGGEVTAGAGSFRSLGSRVTYGRRLGNGLEFLASASLAEIPGPRLYFPEFDRPETNHGITEGTDDERYHREFAQLAWRGLSLQASRASREKGIPTGSYATVFGEPRNRTWDEATQVNLSGDHRLGARGSASLSVNYGRVGYDGDYLFTASPSVVNRDGARGEWWRLEGFVRLAASDRHTLSLGGEFQDNLRQDQFNRDTQPAAVYLDSRADADRWALYARDQWKLPGQLTFDASLRYDRYQTFGGTTSPRLGLVWQRGAALTVKALYGRAFRAPNQYELHYTVEDQEVPQRGNPDLRPETIDTAELVLERALSPHVYLLASAFHSDVRRLIGVTLTPPEGFLVFRNAEQIRSTGLQVGLQLRRGRARGRATYALQRTLAGGSDDRLVNSPSHLARASLTLPIADRLSAGVDAAYMSSRRTLAGRETGDVFRANLTLLAQRLPGRFEASASVYNLFDRRYGDPGSEEHVEDVLFQDGRTFRFNLLWRF
jgi:outer membrane receptor for ferrienterochelin and colicins